MTLVVIGRVVMVDMVVAMPTDDAELPVVVV